jgi:HEAT repeat protein
MRVVMVLARCLVVGILAVPAAHAADEPFWNSRPLGYWLNQLRVGDAAARQQAARGVGEIAIAHGSAIVVAAIPLLVPCLDSPDAPLRAAAADALAPIGIAAGPAGPRLLAMFERDPDPNVRRAAGVALARVRPGSPDLITTSARVLASDEDAMVREAAAAALVEAGMAASPGLSAAEEALDDHDPMVRVFSAAIVARVGNRISAVPVLLDGLTSHDAAVRVEAAGLLADTAPADTAAVPALIAALRDVERQVRLAAVDALATIGRPAKSAIDPLWHLIRDPDEDVRDRALRAIRLIKG